MAFTVLSISFNHISFLENDLKETGDMVTLILVIETLQNQTMKTHPPALQRDRSAMNTASWLRCWFKAK